MEIDITTLFHETNAFDFSASVAERGVNAGPETWRNACNEGRERPLLTTEAELDAARDYFRDFGAWDDEEIAEWSADEVNGLLIQWISGSIRELEGFCMGDDGEIDWNEAERQANNGTVHGDIYPVYDGRIFFSMCN